MNKVRPPLALIAGPTASGKSGLAIALAERSDGLVINADASQLYRGIETISAAPSDEDLTRAAHRVYSFRDPANPCSAAEWAAMAKREIALAHEDDRLPILVGGSGMYLRTLLEGIAPIPEIDAEIREEIRGRPVEENRDELLTLDPKAAGRLAPADTTRIARALEVVRSTGKPLAHWQERLEGGIATDVELQAAILLPPRDWLYQRCDQRFEAMIAEGAIEEVEKLLALKLDPDVPAMRAIGVPEIASFLQNELSRDEMIDAGRQSTRRYAKRQYTWFRHQPPRDWQRFDDPLESDVARDAALALLLPKD